MMFEARTGAAQFGQSTTDLVDSCPLLLLVTAAEIQPEGWPVQPTAEVEQVSQA